MKNKLDMEARREKKQQEDIKYQTEQQKTATGERVKKKSRRNGQSNSGYEQTKGQSRVQRATAGKGH